MEQGIRITQCMIVKNEEKNIRRALSWGQDMMWEQIVIDTGSTDQTVKIAEEMGARVCHFKWIDDFAAAKNYAIEQSGGDWIVFLDADEYMFPEDAKKLSELIERLHNSMYNVLVAELMNLTSWNQLGENKENLREQLGENIRYPHMIRTDGKRFIMLSGVHARIFRRDAGFRYRGRIHEELYTEKVRLVYYDASNELSILHTGYIPSELEEKNKAERNMELIQKEVADHPDNYAMMVCLGNAYLEQKEYTKAVHWYEQAVPCMPGELKEENIPDTMIFKKLITTYMRELSDECSALGAYKRAVRRFPREADYDYLLGQIYTETGRFQEGAYYLQKALTLLDQYGCGILLTHTLTDAWELLIRCYYENGELQKCVSSAVMVLKADAKRKEALKFLLLAFKTDEDRKQYGENAASAAQIKLFLENFYKFDDIKDREYVQKAAEEAEYISLLQEIGR